MTHKSSRWISLSLICIFYLLLNILFNFVIWEQIFIPEKNNVLTIQGESFIYEYFAEVVRQNIVSGQNPFTPASKILYPFGWEFAADDVAPINGLYFLLLRPFFSLHQSLMLIVVISVLFNNISMYALLRILPIGRGTAFLVGLVFGFTPFISVRVGAHPSYTAIYLFPLIFLFLCVLGRTDSKILKAGSAMFLGLLHTISLFTNFYYFVMIIMLELFSCGYLLFFRKKNFLRFLKKNVFYLTISSIIAFIGLVPWLKKVYDHLMFSTYYKPSGLFDTIFYSADLFSIFVPSRLNPFYAPFLTLLTPLSPTLIKAFENYIYPGIFILVVYFYVIIAKKKLPRFLKKNIAPFFTISIVFWLFTLGPFLHVLGKQLPIVLPYRLITMIPIVQMARTPGRFIVPAIFLACIVVAYVVNYFLEKKYTSCKRTIFLILVLLFLIDQSYTITLPPTIHLNLPTAIYQDLNLKTNDSPILEIPFAIRDGLKNLGNFYAVWLPWVQLIHKQSSFGVYGGRINDEIFSYYQKNPLFAGFALLIDRDTKNYKEIASKIEVQKMRPSLEFFGIEYAIIKNNEPYTPYVIKIIEQLDFSKKQTDNEYDLWYRISNPKDFPIFRFGSESDNLYLITGWGEKEKGGRWATAKVAQIFFNLRKGHSSPPKNLYLTARSLDKPQNVRIYVNKKLVKKFTFTSKSATYHFPLKRKLHDGFNIITFKFSNTQKNQNVWKNNPDTRNLAAFFLDIAFEY